MKNKLILTSLAFCLGTTLNASSFFTNNEDSHYKQFHDEVVKLFNDDSFFTTPYKYYKINLSNSYPKMNAFENKKSYTFEFELAGIDKKDIKVSITDQNVLTVSGTKKELTKEEKKDMIRQERYYGSFNRSFSLPDDVDSNKIKVKYQNGILKVIVNKDTKKIKKRVRVLSID